MIELAHPLHIYLYNSYIGGYMKKTILLILLTLNVFAISETPTNQNKNTQCLHKGFYENKSEIDRMIAQENKTAPATDGSTTRR